MTSRHTLKLRLVHSGKAAPCNPRHVIFDDGPGLRVGLCKLLRSSGQPRPSPDLPHGSLERLRPDHAGLLLGAPIEPDRPPRNVDLSPRQTRENLGELVGRRLVLPGQNPKAHRMAHQDDVDKRLQPATVPGQRNAPPLLLFHLKPLPFVGPVSNTARKMSVLTLTYFDYYILRVSPKPLPPAREA